MVRKIKGHCVSIWFLFFTFPCSWLLRPLPSTWSLVVIQNLYPYRRRQYSVVLTYAQARDGQEIADQPSQIQYERTWHSTCCQVCVLNPLYMNLNILLVPDSGLRLSNENSLNSLTCVPGCVGDKLVQDRKRFLAILEPMVLLLFLNFYNLLKNLCLQCYCLALFFQFLFQGQGFYS